MRIHVLLLALAACGSDRVPAAQTSPVTARAASNHTTVVRISPAPAQLAEDGRGHQIASKNPVTVEIETDGWPGRAMEPALHVNDLRFYVYTHSSPTTLRFVVADASLLPEYADASVIYGEYEHARFVLPAVR
ncbi:MAG: hypothetical protein ACI9MC_000907 [Kiritimatiellia bacterium]|jgi:hypothetical protein